MKNFLALQAQRINAMSLRERAILFVSLAAALVAVADALVLSPTLAEQKTLTVKLKQQAAELNTLRSQLAGTDVADTPAARLSRQLQAVQRQQTELDARLRLRLAETSAGPHLPELLERVLRRHERLVLLRLSTAPATPAPSAGGLALQGLDIGLRGNYPELTQYLADAEQALPGLRWGDITISSSSSGGGGGNNNGSAELLARVYLLAQTP